VTLPHIDTPCTSHFCLAPSAFSLSPPPLSPSFFFFFFNDTATTEIYTLSLHDALPIYYERNITREELAFVVDIGGGTSDFSIVRSEEHTSELQSRRDLVCRLLLEKKKKKN